MSEAPAELAGDRRADRRFLLLVAALATVSLVVVALSRQTEAARIGTAETAAEIWLLEGSSHVIIIALAALFPLLVDRFPVERSRLWRAAPVYALAWAVFALAHMLGMHLIRLALFPGLIGQPYTYDTFSPTNLAYEARKDLFVFLLLLAGVLLSRSIEAARLEERQALATAKAQAKIVLRTGGSTHVVAASDIIWARAAANYVEVHTPGKSYFARMTFARLEESLAAAGDRHARIHRSYIVNLDHVVAVEPTGEGDVRVTLGTGDKLPGSRGYRARLDAIAASPRAVQNG